jgi:hypothetical protein
MAGMGWRTTGDVAAFLAAAGDYLRRDRVRNTVPLTVTEQLRAAAAEYAPSRAAGPAARPGPLPDPAAAPLFGWRTAPAGEVAGAFLHTPPHPLLLTAVSAPRSASAHSTRAPRRSCSTPTWPTRCPIPSTRASATAPSKTAPSCCFPRRPADANVADRQCRPI